MAFGRKPNPLISKEKRRSAETPLRRRTGFAEISSYSRLAVRSPSRLIVMQQDVAPFIFRSDPLCESFSLHYFCRRKKTDRLVLAMVAIEPFVVATAIQLVVAKFVFCRTVKGPAPPPAQVRVMPETLFVMPMKVGATAAMLPNKPSLSSLIPAVK